MAKRPIFKTSNNKPYFLEEIISLQYLSGFANVQKEKSIRSLHNAYLDCHPNEKVLEISSKSEDLLGRKLSAFNLKIMSNDDMGYSVESAFQSSKVFENGGPYKDLLYKSSIEAKKDIRIKESGLLKHFSYENMIFPLFPKTFFYDWLYINALNCYPDLGQAALEYTAFTDIVFNPEKSLNCQARAVAIYVSLRKNGLIDKSLESKDSFLEIVYGNEAQCPNVEQTSLWE